MHLAQHNVLVEPHHYAAAKHILRYLAGTVNLRIHYDGSEDRVSVSGCIWFLNGGSVSHSTTKQTTQALVDGS